MPGSIMVDIDGLRTLSHDLAGQADSVSDVVKTIARVPPPDVETYGTQLVADRMHRLLAAWRAELGELREAIDQMGRKAGLAADEAAGIDQDISDQLRPSELGFPEARWLPGRPGKNAGRIERD